MGTIKIDSSFISLPSLLSLLQFDAFLQTIISAYIIRLTRMYNYTVTDSPYCLHGAKTSWTPTLAKVSYKFGFVYLFIYLQCKIWIISFLLIFFDEVRHRKVRKWHNSVFRKTFMGSEGSKTYFEIKSTWLINSSKEEIALSRDSKELFKKRFVKVFDHN